MRYCGKNMLEPGSPQTTEQYGTCALRARNLKLRKHTPNIIIYLSLSCATCWPVPVSHIHKSLQKSTMIPSPSWGVAFVCPASFRETCQWLKFPLNGLRAQRRVNPVVILLPLASGLACLGMAFPQFLVKQLFRCDSIVISSFVRTGYTTSRWGWLLGRIGCNITHHYPSYPLLRICNNYSFHTAIMVARTRDSVTLFIYCLSYSLLHKTQTVCEAQTASYSLRTDSSFPGNKRAAVWMYPLNSIAAMVRIGAPDICSRHLPSWRPREDFTFDCTIR